MTENERDTPLVSCQNASSDKRVGRRKTGRAYRRKMQQLKYQRRYRIITRGGYDPRVGYLRYNFIDDVWQPVSNIIRYPNSSRCQRWIKRETSGKVRRCDTLPCKGNHYRRLFDYWWTLY